ncbi:LOW QUALITY PROTEIN: RAB11-binding protein RELCH homolog [Lepeophtheirus salmonis]|uniref:LOW QUALITY PROTEIN: RAB11-binding protein RELCH homolog n=1 Tax=Lepeophtheirus salmonis TaxID=72036 RepID=UPI003AF35A12
MSKADHRSIAETLLEEGFLLSALEFHTEILERGLPPMTNLKSFFENPSNFEENAILSLDRCASQATLDDSSLWGGMSTEDSRQETDNKLAVLEFELRKARESITTLKEELASKESIHTSIQSKSTENNHDERTISSRELTLLNHLINDYLLENNYKLTSITFSDENADMDFEEWEESLYMKPPNLLSLFRGYYLKGHSHLFKDLDDMYVDKALQTETVEIDHTDSFMQTDDDEFMEMESLKETIEAQNKTIDVLKERFSHMSEALPYSSSSKENIGIQGNSSPFEEVENEEEVTSINDTNDCDNQELTSTTKTLTFPLNYGIYEHVCDKIGLCNFYNQSKYEEESERHFLLGSSLPKIVPNVLLAKREDLIPVIMSVIKHHPDIKVRDLLLEILFNLIKKPDSSQRKMIIEGYVSLAEKFGPSRLESELLPHCWEQIDHKYPSRRTLVAETCVTLMPYIPPSIRNSLVLSMLQQLALDDKDVNVRIAAIKGVSSLLLFMNEAEVDKFNTIWKITTSCLKDTNEQIIKTTQESLLLVSAFWCFTLGQDVETLLGSDPIEDLLRNVIDLHDEASSFWKGIYFKVKTVLLLLPIVISTVFRNTSVEPHECLDLKQRNDEDVFIVLGEKQLLHIQELISGGYCQDSSLFQWFSSNIIEGIVRVSAQIPVNPLTEGVVELLILIIKDIANYVGSSLVEDILKPSFGSYFRPDLPLTSPLYSSSLLPLFLLGLSSNIMTDLKQWISFYVKKSVHSSSIDFVVNEVIENRPDLRSSFLEIIWDFLVSDDPSFRSRGGTYINEVILKAKLDYDFFNVKLLPALVTLASDPELSVRRSAIAGLGSAAVHDLTVCNPELSEKILLQFISLVDGQKDEESLQKLILQLGYIIPISSPKLRDQVLLNKLGELTTVVINERFNTCIEVTLESYRNILNNLILPKSILRSHILPYLRNLSEIVSEQSQKDSVSYILKNVETMAQESNILSPSSNSSIEKLPSSPSMEEVKQKMGKLFAKPSWKK